MSEFDLTNHGHSHRTAQPGRAPIVGAPEFSVPDEPWISESVCSETDPEAFFPEKGGSIKDAKRICWNSCPVREDCLQYALTNDERFGVWGGYSEKERRRLKRGEVFTPSEGHKGRPRGTAA